MPLSCPGLITRDQCGTFNSTRVTTGRTGFTGQPIPAAIVIHKLVGITSEAYGDQLTSPLPKFQCGVPNQNLCLEFPASLNPKSVHFIVTPTSAIQYVELTSTSFGIDYLLGSTWPGLTALLPITDPNAPFIHIVVDGNAISQLVTLLCCIGLELGRSLPILTAHDLQIDRQEFLLDPSIQTEVDNCIVSGGFIQQPSIADLSSDINELQQCCWNNTSDIVVLKQGINQLNGRVLTIEDNLAVVQNQITFLLTQTAIIPTLVSQITVLTNEITDILNRCCPKKTDTVCFHYQLLPGSEMIITANQPVWLNLPTKIEDRDSANCTSGCCGPIVQPGPLWMANLECSTCNSCQTWDVQAQVRFRLAPWCSGKKASLYLVACGKKYLLAEQVISGTGPQSVTLSGNFLLPCGCTDVHLLVANSDDKITTAHVVEFADIKGCCAS